MRASDILELLTIPLLFAGLLLGWLLLVGQPAPWWVVVGLVPYGILAAWAIVYGSWVAATEGA
jgi:hypothetical protein